MRRRRNKGPRWASRIMWCAMGTLVAWGLWQAHEVRRSVMLESQHAAVVSLDDAQTAAASDPALRPIVQLPYLPPLMAATGAIQPSVVLIGLDSQAGPFGSEVPAFPGNLSADDLRAKAAALLDAGQIARGRAALNAALWRAGDGPDADPLRRQLATLNSGVFLGSDVLPDDPFANFIEIQPGDTFLKLGHQFDVPASYLEAVNPNLNARNLKPLTGLKVVQGPFNLRLVKHARRMDLYLRDLYVRSYPVQLEEGYYLPQGEYRIAAGTKVQVQNRVWIGFEGDEPATLDVTAGSLYGSAGPRGAARNQASGIRIADEDLWQIYNLVVETKSLLRVDP